MALDVQSMRSSLPLPPVDNEERTTIKLYTGTEVQQTIKRDLLYGAMHPRDLFNFLRTHVSTFSLYGSLGGAVTGAAGSFYYISKMSPPTASSDENQTKSQLSFVACGAFGGAVVGGIVGASTAFSMNILQISSSNHFRAWKAKAIQDKVLPIFEEFIRKNEDLLSEFICPITGELIQVPVKKIGVEGKAKYQVYEKNDIEGWIDRKNKELSEKAETGAYQREAQHTQDPDLLQMDIEHRIEVLKMRDRKMTSPNRDCVLSKADLFYDPTYHERLFERIRQIYNEQVDQTVRAGLGAYSQDAIAQRNQIIGAEIKHLTDLWMNKNISTEEYHQRTKELTKLELKPSFI
jgi:hypothetical protein